MSEVKRYAPHWMYQEMRPAHDDDEQTYVESEDYDHLRAELASWRRTCEKITEERDEARRLIDEARKQEPQYAVPVSVAVKALGYVGSANYKERCREAQGWIDAATFEAYAAPVPAQPAVRRVALIGPDAERIASSVALAQPAVPDDVAKYAACWKHLVAMHKFNNNPAVGFAINRAKEKAAILPTTTKGRSNG